MKIAIVRVWSSGVISCGLASGYKLAECCLFSICRIEGRVIRTQSAYTCTFKEVRALLICLFQYNKNQQDAIFIFNLFQ